MTKLKFNEISMMIDLTIDDYDIYNPIIIAEKIKEDFDEEISIPTIDNYLSLLEPDRYKIEMENNAYHYYY
jgi:hypothetical protein